MTLRAVHAWREAAARLLLEKGLAMLHKISVFCWKCLFYAVAYPGVACWRFRLLLLAFGKFATQPENFFFSLAQLVAKKAEIVAKD